jgi:hypothetical protein
MKVQSKLVGNTPTQEIDWDKPQLLISKETGLIVLSTGEHGGTDFHAFVLIDTKNAWLTGNYGDNWKKEYFTILPPNQQVILQNTPDEL